MNRSQFKDPVCDLCLTGAVVASSSLTLETTGSNPFNDKYFFSLKISVKTFRKNSIIPPGKSNVPVDFSVCPIYPAVSRWDSITVLLSPDVKFIFF